MATVGPISVFKSVMCTTSFVLNFWHRRVQVSFISTTTLHESGEQSDSVYVRYHWSSPYCSFGLYLLTAEGWQYGFVHVYQTVCF